MADVHHNAIAGSLRDPGADAASVAIEQWPDRLQRVIDQHCTLLKRIIVLRETGSTQDAARRMDCKPGDVITAWRQTTGRGRLGRAWADTGEEGVAVTFILDRGDLAPERLAIASAIGAAHAIEAILNKQVGIKWPNDIIVNSRKIAGILIEQADDLALVGIGINVQQKSFPDEIANRAISLAQIDCVVDRVVVLELLLNAIDRSLHLSDAQIIEEFTRRDVLRDSVVTLSHRGARFTGTVLRIDPMRGLTLQTERGEIWLDAAATSVIPDAKSDAKPESHPTNSCR